MSTRVDVLAVLDRQLRDRAERANRYRKNAEKSARKSGEPQITADRMAAYTDLQLVELREARAAVADLIAERDALAQEVERLQGDGVHTCGPHCRRIACVLRRERDDLLDVLGTLTEHFEYYMGDNECRPLENARAALARAQGVQS